jgi:hypothetical protein
MSVESALRRVEGGATAGRLQSRSACETSEGLQSDLDCLILPRCDDPMLSIGIPAMRCDMYPSRPGMDHSATQRITISLPAAAFKEEGIQSMLPNPIWNRSGRSIVV